ncbi:hypothetical protein [Aeromonas bestiarum]|uniref:hypothetical protein n=1 Tax=Aeromonas bestiarum TaxID=105751 RepID=UPI00050465C3|nr:hypothetical protein [Aeromonas bestiarum]KFN19077.1 hypothetical protein JM66_11960 [Aeromonas bestiarum]
MLIVYAWEVWGKRGAVVVGALLLAFLGARIAMFKPPLELLWNSDNSLLCIVAGESGFVPEQNIDYCRRLFTEKKVLRAFEEPSFYGYMPGVKVQTDQHAFRKLHQALSEQDPSFFAQVPSFEAWWNELPVDTKSGRG